MQGLVQVCVPDSAWTEADACVRALALCRIEAGVEAGELPDEGLLA
jgi:hypothetical protein